MIRENFFFKIHAKNEAGRLVPDLFLIFKKCLYEVSMWSAAQLQYVSIVLNLTDNKNKLYKTLIDPEIC